MFCTSVEFFECSLLTSLSNDFLLKKTNNRVVLNINYQAFRLLRSKDQKKQLISKDFSSINWQSMAWSASKSWKNILKLMSCESNYFNN